MVSSMGAASSETNNVLERSARRSISATGAYPRSSCDTNECLIESSNRDTYRVQVIRGLPDVRFSVYGERSFPARRSVNAHARHDHPHLAIPSPCLFKNSLILISLSFILNTPSFLIVFHSIVAYASVAFSRRIEVRRAPMTGILGRVLEMMNVASGPLICVS